MVRAQVLFMISFVLSVPACAEMRMNAGVTHKAECGVDTAEFAADLGYRPLRLIKDPSTGRGWLIEQSIEHPAWPARLIQLQEVEGFRPRMSGQELAPKGCGLRISACGAHCRSS